MAGMREIKLRIKSINETRQITKAMKLISSAKLKKAKNQLDQTLPFFKKVNDTIADILMHSGNLESIYFDTKKIVKIKKVGFIILTGDKGLAGGYNNNIIKLAEHSLIPYTNPLLFVAGHVGRGYFSRSNYNMFEEFDYPVQNPTVYRAREIAETVLDLYKDGDLDEVYIVYTMMISTINLVPKITKLLPLDLGELKKDIGYSDNSKTKIDDLMKYEPSATAVFDVLISKYLKGVIYGALVEAFASEQSSRMTAMDNATSNADDMLKSLNLFYNRARQAAITQEISEIVGGAAALQ